MTSIDRNNTVSTVKEFQTNLVIFKTKFSLGFHPVVGAIIYLWVVTLNNVTFRVMIL